MQKNIYRSLLVLTGAGCFVPALFAATLTQVPMQGGMVMPMIAYHAEHGHLHIMMDTNIPALTPLLASNPADNFDPADPWFDALDPAREGRAFSRRYGFVMDAVTDPLPANTQIWIRKLSGAPELGVYRYAATPETWQPIFGTDGATNALYWNGMMFHPCFTAPAGTNSYAATFQAYLLDTTTGLEVPDSASGVVTSHWTSVPDGRPTLGLGQRIVVFYPGDTTTNWSLEGADALSGGTWSSVTNAPVSIEGQAAVVLEPGEARKFFRMKYTP
jgi:hypothetical protein